MQPAIPRACNGSSLKCLHCGHSRPHICRNPTDSCIQGDQHKHLRVAVECEPIPSDSELDKLTCAVEDAEDQVDDAQSKVDEAQGQWEEAQYQLQQARAALKRAQTLESARDYCNGDTAAVSLLPVI